jgi:zinc ribbon protein
MFLVWALIGAMIGVVAAQKKGFSMLVGVLGGLLLGPLALLMFFVSGVSDSDQNKKCPYCAEWVKAEATICKHCHQPLTPPAPGRPPVPPRRPA